jgi:hypothetical protein
MNMCSVKNDIEFIIPPNNLCMTSIVRVYLEIRVLILVGTSNYSYYLNMINVMCTLPALPQR